MNQKYKEISQREDNDRAKRYSENGASFLQESGPGTRQAASEIPQMLVFPRNMGVCKNAFGPG